MSFTVEPTMKEPSTIETEAGRTIELMEKQSQRISCWISRSFDPGSNVSEFRRCKPAKHFAGRTSTIGGTQIDCRFEHPQNAFSPISLRFEPASKLSLLRAGIVDRAESQSVVRDAGR
jgi:hypothetical protein